MVETISSPAAARVSDGERLGRLAGGRGQRRRAAFERRHALLKDVGGGVHDAGVDVAELLQREEPAGVVGILEEIGSGLVDGHGAGAGGGVGRLAGVDGKRGELLRFGSDMMISFRFVGSMIRGLRAIGRGPIAF